MADMEVSIAGAGTQSNIEVQVDPSFQAMRISQRPLEFSFPGGQPGGHYKMAFTWSNTAALPAANSNLVALRWADPTKLMVIKRISITVGITTSFTNAQLLDYNLIKVTNYIGDPMGGNAITFVRNGGSQRMRTQVMNPSQLVSSGAAVYSSGSAVTPGQCILDDFPMGYVQAANQSGAAANNIQTYTPTKQSLFDSTDLGVHPFILSQDEGFVIQNGTAYGAAGVVKHGVEIYYIETTSY